MILIPCSGWFKLSLFWQGGGLHIVCVKYKTFISSPHLPFSQKSQPGFSFRGWTEEALQWQTECLWNIRFFKFLVDSKIQRKDYVSQGGSDRASCSDRQEFEPAGNLQPTESGMLVCWHLVTGRSLRLLKVLCFIFSIFLYHQLKLRTVRTSFHQRGSMWTILRDAWTCARCQD